MACTKVHAIIMGYVLLAKLMHPCLCENILKSPAADSTRTSDGKAIDQGIAYLLMLVALLVTYLVH